MKTAVFRVTNLEVTTSRVTNLEVTASSVTDLEVIASHVTDLEVTASRVTFWRLLPPVLRWNGRPLSPMVFAIQGQLSPRVMMGGDGSLPYEGYKAI